MKIYSKISNKNTVGFRLKVIEFLLLIHLPLFFILFFVRINHNYKEELGILSGISFVFLILLFFRMRYFEFDSSGEVISIKSYHPVFKSSERRSEFPKQKLQDFKVKKNFGGADLKINLKMADKKSTSIKFSIQGFSLNQVKNIEKTLQKTKKDYEEAIV